ncbi:MAG: alpha-galactosidase [Bacteroidaceae bacterium]|nr:alpha-galactosidase [Bacteroidaceae bacterium]
MKQQLTFLSQSVGKVTSLALLLLSSSIPGNAEKIEIHTPNNSLVVDLWKDGEPKFVYYGQRLSTYDLNVLPEPTNANWSHLELFPAYGATHTMSETALAMTHVDGNMSTNLLVQDYKVTDISDKAPNGKERSGKLLTITLKDPLYPSLVHLYYQAYNDVDMIECWSDIENLEKGTVKLTQFYSSCMPIRRGDVYVSHFHGSWAAEAQLVEEKLNNGMLVIKNKDGLRNATTDRQEVMFSLEGKAQENAGDVIGAALMYSGNYQITIDTDDSEYHYYFAGINPDNSEYLLKKGETFTTPHVAYTFSNEGLSGASRNYHTWARNYQLRHADKQRDILLNSWEGVYFDINQKGMDQMMADIASMGGELFVMDDGWFGDKYPRKTDNSSLGDWVVDKNKLPEGIEGLLRDAKKNGVKFGIWIEPEMSNTTSELYEKHPDWIIKAPGRKPVLGRGGTQVVLDLSNPKVQDFVFNIVDNLLTKYPEIAYIKWDANAPVMNHGSQYLSKNEQSHLYIDYHKGLIKVCQRIRDKYPDVIIQDCASGGGRANYALLPYFDEFWVSDDTDALQRIYMQWGTSYFFPAIAMASHISATPNHQTFRTIPLKFRCDVAMSGRLGMEIQPKNMTEAEKTLCRQAISDYKKIRPIVQFGNLYRLHSPYAGDNLASLMYVSDNKQEAVFYWYKLETFVNQHLPRIKMAGLDPSKKYTVHELNKIDTTPLDCEGKTYTGDYLMKNGLEVPFKHIVNYHDQNDWASRVIYLKAN